MQNLSLQDIINRTKGTIATFQCEIASLTDPVKIEEKRQHVRFLQGQIENFMKMYSDELPKEPKAQEHFGKDELIKLLIEQREELSKMTSTNYPISAEDKVRVKKIFEIDEYIEWIQAEKGNVQNGPGFNPKELVELGVLEIKTSEPTKEEIFEEFRKWKESNKTAEADKNRKIKIKGVKEEWEQKHSTKPVFQESLNVLQNVQKNNTIRERAIELYETSDVVRVLKSVFFDFVRLETEIEELKRENDYLKLNQKPAQNQSQR